MFRKNKHIVKTTISLHIVVAILFCVLFGQGAHLHFLDIHISSHFDVHTHLHAHESHDKPLQADHDHNQENNKHQHEVRTSTDIIGTLTSLYQLKTEIQSQAITAWDAGSNTINPRFQQSPTLFDLPPPRPVANQYFLSSFSHRGPPIS